MATEFCNPIFVSERAIVSGRFLVEFLGSFMYKMSANYTILSSPSRENLSSLPVCITFISFSCIIDLASASALY